MVFERIVIPPAVAGELQHASTPAIVRAWIATPPAWLEVCSPAGPVRGLSLGVGEVEAIALALEFRADWSLADDLKARQAATNVV